MTYIEHIRRMNDWQLAHFLNGIQPEIELFMQAVTRAESFKPNLKDSSFGLSGDARTLLNIMRKDYDQELQREEGGKPCQQKERSHYRKCSRHRSNGRIKERDDAKSAGSGSIAASHAPSIRE